MDMMTLTAQNRELTGRKTSQLRSEGLVPAVVYGYGTEPQKITVDRNRTEKIYSEAGESSVIELEVEGKKMSVLIQDTQRDPLTGFLTHADFRAVDLTKTVETTIALELVGEAPAVKELGGTIIQSLEEVDVEALPGALVPEIEVDATVLKTFDDVIRVSDLPVPEGVTILNDPNTAVASVAEPRSEEEMEALNEAVEEDVSGVEVTTEKKEEAAGEEEEKKA